LFWISIGSMQNIRSMAAHAELHGYQLRPTVKVHKSTAIARRQVNAGAVGVCCATLSEAEAMVEA
jgi:D-serine deaminase-like pyridoxal phosphate-dependent protein